MTDVLNKLVKIMIMIYVISYLASCESNFSLLLEDKNMNIKIQNELNSCFIPSDNDFMDNIGLPYIYIDTCNLNSIFILYELDDKLLDNYLFNPDLESMNHTNKSYHVPISSEVLNNKVEIENLKYQFNVEPYIIEDGMDRLTKVSYATYSKFYIDKKGYYSIEVRKIISEYLESASLNLGQ